MARGWTVAIWALVAMGMGCSSQEAAAPDVGVEADASTARDMEAPADAAGPVDGGLVGECPGQEVMCSAKARQVGCRCVRNIDRRCEADRHCRPEERCEPLEGQTDQKVCRYTPAPVRACPGAEGCEATPGEGLLAGAAARPITPVGFETVRPEAMRGSQITFNPPGEPSQWFDCGLDGLCPDDEGYQGPDDGEADGVLQGVWLAGFSPGRPAQYCPPERIGCQGPECCVSKFAHDDVEVRVVVMRQGGVTVAMAALDVVGFFRDEMEAIRAMIPEEWGIDLLLMASTHNHEGPDATGQWGPGAAAPLETGFTPSFRRRIQEQTLAALEEAVGGLAPAVASAGVLDVGVEGLAISDSRPPYIFDDNVPVVVLRRAQAPQETIATMLSFGNHAEVLWSQNQLITSDYPHFVRRYIEQGLEEVRDPETGEVVAPGLEGLGGVTVFFAGAVGGLINPGRGGAIDRAGQVFDDQSWAAADAVGQRLAAHVLGAAQGDGLQALTDPALRFATREIMVPIYNLLFQLAGLQLGVFERNIYNAIYNGVGSAKPGPPEVLSEVTTVGLGPVTFFTAPGEVFPELLVGGFPGRSSVQTPVLGDVEGRRVELVCGPDGLPLPEGEVGTSPCLVAPDQENPPDWSKAPQGPWVYEQAPGQIPFFVGLGQDFLGYMVPPYDYEYPGYAAEAPGAHYEETNSAGPTIVESWQGALKEVFEALPPG